MRLYEEAMPDDSIETFVDSVKRIVLSTRRRFRQSMCPLIHGRHELYRVNTPFRIYQECLLCGKETKGWKLDPRNKKLHLVK